MQRRKKTAPLMGIGYRCAIALASIALTTTAASAQWRDVWLTQSDDGLNATQVDFEVEVDSNGHAVTVGYVDLPGSGADFLLRKYDRTGKLLWTTTFDAGGNGDDFFFDIIIDSSDNIYANGTGVNVNGNTDVVTLKFNTDGQLLWSRLFDGPASGADESYGWPCIGLDANEDVYVCGYSTALDGVFEFVTIKYDAAGSQQWVSKYRGPNAQSPHSYGYSMAVTPAGDVFTGGNVRNLNGDIDYAVVKYDSNGNELWSQLFDSIYQGDESLYTLVIDDDENVYASGISDSAFLNGDFEYCTVKWDTNGNEQWSGRYGGNYGFHYGWVSAVDGVGGVYVTGASITTGGEYDIATVHYDANGNVHWVRRYSDPLWFGDDWAQYIRTDADGNVLVAGYGWSGHGESENGYLIKYSPNGDLLDEVEYDSELHGPDRWNSVAVDDAGRVIVAGVSLGLGTSADSIVAKYTEQPAPELTISPEPPVAGQVATFAVTDMEPMSPCYLGYSLVGQGNLFVPFLNATLNLQQPIQAGGPKMSDPGGTVVWQLPIPANAGGVNVWFQAAQYNQVTNVVPTQIQ